MTKSRLFNFCALTVCTQNAFAIISRDRKGTIVAKVAKNQGFTLLNTKDYFWTKMFRKSSQILSKFKKSEEVVRNCTRCTWSPGISYIYIYIYKKTPDRPLPAAVTGSSSSSSSSSSLREFPCVTHVILALECKKGSSKPRKITLFRIAFRKFLDR